MNERMKLLKQEFQCNWTLESSIRLDEIFAFKFWIFYLQYLIYPWSVRGNILEDCISTIEEETYQKKVISHVLI